MKKQKQKTRGKNAKYNQNMQKKWISYVTVIHLGCHSATAGWHCDIYDPVHYELGQQAAAVSTPKTHTNCVAQNGLSSLLCVNWYVDIRYKYAQYGSKYQL